MKADRFDVAAALVFIASAAVTIAWCASMARMPGMDMPGGWVMSMAWMRMPGQGWLESAAGFIVMWAVMMVAMMSPVLAPQLSRYRRNAGVTRGNSRAACVAAGYFAVWIASGALLFPLGVMFAQWTMAAPEISSVVPAMGAAAVVAAGFVQLSPWKDRQLERCCHAFEPVNGSLTRYASAWRQGMNLGLRCFYCCASLTAVLLVIGVMDLRAMALVTMAISAERLLPARVRAARVVGVCLIFTGVLLSYACWSFEGGNDGASASRMRRVKPEITLARPADARALVALRSAVARHMTALHGEGHWSAIPSRPEIVRQMRASQVFVARVDAQLVGTVRLATVNPHSMRSAGFTEVPSALYVLGMTVSEEYRRMGVGRALLAVSKDAAHARRASALWVDTYAGAAGAGPFYLRCGFRQVGPLHFEWLADS